jgi:hypothetical protein
MKIFVSIFLYVVFLSSIFAYSNSDSLVHFRDIDNSKFSVSASEQKQKLFYHFQFDMNNLNFPEKADPLVNKVNYGLLSGLGAAYLGIGTCLHIYLSNTLWKRQKDYSGKFSYINDWNNALWIDKLGHCYATQLLGHAFSGAIEAADIQSEQSTWYSASLATLYELYLEVEDGYSSPKRGFSSGDVMSDFAGAAFYISQYYYPFLKNFQFRMSYVPSQDYKDTPDKTIIEDYEGQKFWISMRIKNMLPESAAKYWPAILNISAGMGIKNYIGPGIGQREFYLAFDIDAEEIPLSGRYGQFIKNTLNFIHFPMPGIRITPKTTFFVFCF